MADPLDDVIDRLRKVDELGVRIARDAMPSVLAEAKRTAAAGTSAEGATWAPTKDGRRALPQAAGAITAVVSGASKAVLTLVLTGPYAFWNGMKGKRQRPILFKPEAGVPEAMAKAIASAAKRVVGRAMGGS